MFFLLEVEVSKFENKYNFLFIGSCSVYWYYKLIYGTNVHLLLLTKSLFLFKIFLPQMIGNPLQLVLQKLHCLIWCIPKLLATAKNGILSIGVLLLTGPLLLILGRFHTTLWTPALATTWPPTLSILLISSGLSGLWSCKSFQTIYN